MCEIEHPASTYAVAEHEINLITLWENSAYDEQEEEVVELIVLLTFEYMGDSLPNYVLAVELNSCYSDTISNDG